MKGGEKLKCASCGRINRDEAKFCLYCGKSLTTAKLILNNRVIEIKEREASFGREDFVYDLSENDLMYVSRKTTPHFKIIKEDYKFYILDDSSAGGTKLNGIEIKGKGRQELNSGSEIILADVLKMKFQIGG